MKQVTASVISNSKVMPETYLIWLDSPEIAPDAKPGQFVMVHCGEDILLPRPLSIHQRDSDKIALLVNLVGKGTGWLSERNSGDTLELFGPLGNGFSIDHASKNLLLVAGGMGIAPLRFLADEGVAYGKKVTLLMGASSDVHIAPVYLPDGSARVSKLITRQVLPSGRILKVTEDGSAGHQGMVTDFIPGHVDWADQVFACGPLPMYKAMGQMPELKDKPVQISLEVGMGCGRGLCYGCTIKTKNGLKKVCQDGPVFDLDDILWDELDCF